MAKGTIILLFALGILASLLLGVNIGKRLERSFSKQSFDFAQDKQPTTIPTAPPIPTVTVVLLEASPSAATTVPATKGTSTFTDRTCGFTFSYPGSYLRQKTVNEQSVIFTDPNNPQSIIATTCASSIPRPPVEPSKIEAIILDNEAVTLFHDQNPDGTPRDEVIARHPTNGMEIIIAGYGPSFQNALSSFKFIK